MHVTLANVQGILVTGQRFFIMDRMTFVKLLLLVSTFFFHIVLSLSHRPNAEEKRC